MKSQERPNPYEYLRLTDAQCPPRPLEADERQLKITSDNKETAIIVTARWGEYWCGGLQFYWRHGAVSYHRPDPANGLFRTEREARLYYIGYLSLYLDYFAEETKLAVTAALDEYQQQSLF